MSVLVLDLEVYEAIYKKACEYQYNNEVNIEHCHTLSENEDYLKTVIRDWLYLNELSHSRRYREEEEPFLSTLLTFKGGKKINAYQMLKYLQCVMYNIEISTIKNGYDGTQGKMNISDTMMHSYKILGDAISEISQSIIAQIPQYKKANWSNI